MKKWGLQEVLNDIQQNIKEAKNGNMETLIVDADESKGFNYPYILVYPKSNMRSTLVIGCLNNYETPMPSDTIDNQTAIDEVFNLFGSDRINSSTPVNLNGQTQEEYKESKERIAKRVGRASNNIAMLLTGAGFLQADVPILMPLIPGYITDTLEHTASEISKDFAGDVDVQVVKMIEHARKVIEERTNISLDSRVISYGHSKSSTFANNFTTLHPEMVQALIVGGCEHTTLPIEEIRLRVTDKIKEKEQFEIIDGIAYKNITQDELDRIIDEYNASKEINQRDIVQNEDGSFSLPMNYPLGIADIEQYVDISIFPNGKQGLKQSLAQIPRMLFVGEREEEVEGKFSYGEGINLEGTRFLYAEDLDGLYEGGRKASDMYEVEKSSMHNRILQYKAATLALFGRGDNERLRNYMELATKLGLDVQSKIYEKVGHRGIYGIKELADDTTQSLVSVSEGKRIPKLSDKGGVQRISPIFQLLRRAKVCPSGNKADYQAICSRLPSLPKEPEEEDYQNNDDYKAAMQQYEKVERDYYIQLEMMMSDIDVHILSTRQITSETNMDRVYDELTTEELQKIFLRKKSLSMDRVQDAVEATELEASRIAELNGQSTIIRNVLLERDGKTKLETPDKKDLDD